MYAIMFYRLFNQLIKPSTLLNTMECLIAFVIPILSVSIGFGSACVVAYELEGIPIKWFLLLAVCVTSTTYLVLMGLCRYACNARITFLSAGILPLTTLVASTEQTFFVMTRKSNHSRSFPAQISLGPPQQKSPHHEDLTLAFRNLSSIRRRF